MLWEPTSTPRTKFERRACCPVPNEAEASRGLLRFSMTHPQSSARGVIGGLWPPIVRHAPSVSHQMTLVNQCRDCFDGSDCVMGRSMFRLGKT